MSQELKCKAEETSICCCVDVGTVLDNSESTANVELMCASEEEAQEKLAQLSQKAADVASEPCEISSDISAEGDSYKLKAAFTFSCQAESLIFELGLR